MIYDKIVPMMDMVQKMVTNKDDHEMISKFIDSSYPKMKEKLLISDIQNCTACTLYPTNHVPFEGSFDAEIMLIGEGPGEEEEKLGKPFVGPSGKLLDAMLEAATENINRRWNRDNLFITNVIKCRAHDNGKNRKPSVNEIASCSPILNKEIELVRPKLILCLGTTAASYVIHPDFKIMQEHGKLFENKDLGYKAMAVYHPSFVLHQGVSTPMGKERKREMWADLMNADKVFND